MQQKCAHKNSRNSFQFSSRFELRLFMTKKYAQIYIYVNENTNAKRFTCKASIKSIRWPDLTPNNLIATSVYEDTVISVQGKAKGQLWNVGLGPNYTVEHVYGVQTSIDTQSSLCARLVHIDVFYWATITTNYQIYMQLTFLNTKCTEKLLKFISLSIYCFSVFFISI